ncbi:LysM peptidoglycan-binding domain-containing protein [Furfurilactobacillus curtus]|uniref:Gamma-D-glutamate-meso-diaminopimelate muropeptidase n=1 Tax=Furfurilactobacillus curtus TaxID=1746200 RepID=A0ABQ5JTY3_9LACO
MNKTLKATLLTSTLAVSLLAGTTLANASTVTAVKGDTVWAFAQKHHTSVDAIAKASHLANPALIQIGQTITIPDAQGSTAPQPQPQSAAPASQATSQAAPVLDANGDYVVVTGDTLSTVSEKLGLSMEQLVAANGLVNANFLSVGQVLHTQVPVSQAPAASQAPAVSQASAAPSATLASQAPATISSEAPASQNSQGQVTDSTVAQTTSAATSAQVQTPQSTQSTTITPASTAPSAAPQLTQAQQTPASQAAPTTPAPVTPAASAPVATDASSAGIAGFRQGINGYPAGQCTSFVAGILQAEGIPAWQFSYLGDGANWGNSARAKGIAVNNQATAGSVAYFAYNHVAYVTGVNGDGTVNIIEGNFNGLAYHARTISASEAAGYIHF